MTPIQNTKIAIVHMCDIWYSHEETDGVVASYTIQQTSQGWRKAVGEQTKHY